jgi:cytosolic 5'-nucleotidase 3
MKETEIIIANPERLAKLKAAIAADGPEKFHVLADFDRTLTRAFTNGGEYPSLISVLRNDGYLTPDYPARATALYERYRPIETDPNISREEKKAAMAEWWRTHFELLVASRLKKSDIAKAAASQDVQLRDGAEKMLKFLAKKNVPLVIMSSAGLGTEGISLFLKNLNLLSDNIFIASNEFVWDENGQAVAVKEPIIHSLNKDETLAKDFPFYDKIENRKNVLLLGDNAEDVDMILGFAYDNLIKVGFLNKNIEKNLPLFKKKF